MDVSLLPPTLQALFQSTGENWTKPPDWEGKHHAHSQKMKAYYDKTDKEPGCLSLARQVKKLLFYEEDAIIQFPNAFRVSQNP